MGCVKKAQNSMFATCDEKGSLKTPNVQILRWKSDAFDNPIIKAFDSQNEQMNVFWEKIFV